MELCDIMFPWINLSTRQFLYLLQGKWRLQCQLHDERCRSGPWEHSHHATTPPTTTDTKCQRFLPWVNLTKQLPFPFTATENDALRRKSCQWWNAPPFHSLIHFWWYIFYYWLVYKGARRSAWLWQCWVSKRATAALMLRRGPCCAEEWTACFEQATTISLI